VADNDFEYSCPISTQCLSIHIELLRKIMLNVSLNKQKCGQDSKRCFWAESYSTIHITLRRYHINANTDFFYRFLHTESPNFITSSII